MYIEAVPNRGSPPAILLRESFRDYGRVKKRTLANLSDWPTALVEGFRTLLKAGIAVAAEGIGIRRALSHGHAAAVLGTIRLIGLDPLLRKRTDQRPARGAVGDRLDRQPADLADLQASNRARSHRRHRLLEPGPAARARRGRRSRALPRPRLARRTPGRGRDRARPPPSQRGGARSL